MGSAGNSDRAVNSPGYKRELLHGLVGLSRIDKMGSAGFSVRVVDSDDTNPIGNDFRIKSWIRRGKIGSEMGSACFSDGVVDPEG